MSQSSSSSTPSLKAADSVDPFALPPDLHTPKLDSWVWKYFRLSHANPDYGWCGIDRCAPSKRHVARLRGNTSGIITHLSVHHSITAKTSSSASSSSSPATVDALFARQVKATTPCSPALRTLLDAHVADFFIANCLAFNVAESPSFTTLLLAVSNQSYTPPARTKLTATVDRMYDTMVDVLLADIRQNTISITSDAATLDNGHSYLAVTAHYITADMVLRDVTLLVSRMSGSHTGEYVGNLLDMTITAWEADDRCFAAVTDNGANFVKAARIASKVQDELRCACHTLQLALKDAVASQPSLKQLCVDAQRVVAVIRRSSLLTEELDDIQQLEAAALSASAAEEVLHDGEDVRQPLKPLRLAMNVPTRFNSMCILFGRLIEARSAVQRVCINRAADFDGKALTSDQWDQMVELHSVFYPVKVLCDQLETSSSPSLSLLIPLTLQLVADLGELYTDLKIASCRAVCLSVRTCVHSRMTASLSDSTTMISLMLDPRVRTAVIDGFDKAAAERVLRSTFVEFPTTLARYRGSESVSLRHTVSQSSEDRVDREPKRTKYELKLRQESSVVRDSISEIDVYVRDDVIGMDECPLRWWKERRARYPVLSEMARVYLAVPASSAPSERVFSVAKLVLTDKRKQLLESRVARLMFMKRNMKLYNELKSNNTKK